MCVSIDQIIYETQQINLSTPNHIETRNYTYLDGKSRIFFENEENGSHVEFVGEI